MLNPPLNKAHRRALRAMAAAREFWGRGDDEAGQRAYETAMSHYLRAGLSPDWFEDGGLGSAKVEDVATPRDLTITGLRDDATGAHFLVLSDTPLSDETGDEYILTIPEHIQQVKR